MSHQPSLAQNLRQTPSRTLKLAVMAVLLPLLARPALAEPVTYTLDPAHLTVAFMIEHIGYAKILGVFHEAGGTYTFDADTDEVSDIAVTILTGSVDTFDESRDNHVRSKDFLNVKKFPEMTFTGLDVTNNADNVGQVTGNLSLLGTTQTVTLEVTRNKSEPYPFGRNPPNTMGMSLRGKISRSDFGMTYGVANGLVGDDIELIIELEASADS